MHGRKTRSVYPLAAILSLVAFLALGFEARAQSSGAFGQRDLGGRISNPQGSFGGTPAADFEQEGAGEVSGSERFVRDARQPGQFVGADSGDTRSFFTQQGNAARLNNQPTNRNANRNANRQNSGQIGNQQSGTRILRRRLHAGFRYPQLSSTKVRSSIIARLNRLTTPNSPLGIQVAMQGRTVLLQGAVASEAERKLAATLVSLEPGVSDVRNELEVSALVAPSPRVEQVPAFESPSDATTVPNSEVEGPAGS